MTKNRAGKAFKREVQQLTGMPYAAVAKLIDRFEEVLEAEPLLNRAGLGLGNGSMYGKTREERRAKLATWREELQSAHSVANVLRVHDWLLANITPIKTPTRGSYGLKHVAERALGDYVANGELIAAALMAGYPMRPDFNPLFGMSQRDLKRVGG
jgi:hypothetical protein